MPTGKAADGMGQVLRSLAAAGKALRLYPPSSPIRVQSVEAATREIERQLEVEPVLSLVIAREGFTHRGESLGEGIPGVAEFADGLRVHGVAEVAFSAGMRSDELLRFLELVAQDPDALRSDGGLPTALAILGVGNVHVTGVQLTVAADEDTRGAIEDIDGFLRALATDPDKLSAWLASAAATDPETFAENLQELALVVGDTDRGLLLRAFAEAFMRQTADGRDAVLGIAMEEGSARDLVGEMFTLLDGSDIAGALLAGTFGRNMLSLSSALTRLPLDGAQGDVKDQVRTMLPAAGKSAKEASFLDHMLEARASSDAEPAVIDTVAAYRAVASAGVIAEDTVTQARAAVVSSRDTLRAAGVRTMLTLLDQHEDFDLYCRAAGALAAVVPRLVQEKQLDIAALVVAELQRRQAVPTGPWPELSSRLQASLSRAVGPETMDALLHAVMTEPGSLPLAESIVHLAGEAGARSITTAAIAEKTPGIEAAGALLGRRLLDQLAAAAPHTPWHRIGPVVAHLARAGDAHSIDVIAALLQSADSQSRREIAVALGNLDTPAAVGLLERALHDFDVEVAAAAARSLGLAETPGAAQALTARLGELDIDGSGFQLASEIIAALSRLPDPIADATLDELASRRQFLKRGHHSQIQALVQEAIRRRRSRRVST